MQKIYCIHRPATDTPGEKGVLERESHTTQMPVPTTWQIVPNPANNRIFIPGMDDTTGYWRMVDAAGRVLKSGRNGYWSGEGGAVGELPSGVYYLYLSTSKKNQILRFVKQ